MMAKFKSQIKKSKIEVNIDLSEELKGLNKTQASKIKTLVGESLLRLVDEDLDQAQSPVNGATFKGLSKDYAKFKKSKGKGGKPDLQLTQLMNASLGSKNTANGVQLKITDSLQKKKSFNHNVGDTLPKRQYLPKGNRKFRSEIMDKIDRLIEKAKDGF
jgi:hypothetical protein